MQHLLELDSVKWTNQIPWTGGTRGTPAGTITLIPIPWTGGTGGTPAGTITLIPIPWMGGTGGTPAGTITLEPIPWTIRMEPAGASWDVDVQKGRRRAQISRTQEERRFRCALGVPDAEGEGATLC